MMQRLPARISVLTTAFLLAIAACGGSPGSSESGSDASAVSESSGAEASSGEPAQDATTVTTEPAPEPTPLPTEPVIEATAVESEADLEFAEEPEAAPDVVFPLTISDALGNEFTFDAPVTFGCIWRGCTEVHADLGVPERAGSILYSANGDAKSPLFYPAGPPEYVVADYRNPEDWAGSAVDAVVSRPPVNPAIEGAAGDLAATFYVHAPTYAASSRSGLDAYLDNIWMFGQMLDEPQAAADVLADYDAMMTNLAALSTPELAARTVSILINSEEYFLLSERSPFCDVIQTTGLGNCVLIGDNGEMNPEAYLALDPGWIIYYSGATNAADRRDPVWSELTAVENGKVYDSVNNEYGCCSARTLLVALQEFVHFTVPGSDVPAPLPFSEFDPATSPLFDR